MKRRVGLILLVVFLLAACNRNGPAAAPIDAPISAATSVEQALPTLTPVAPASTAVQVNPTETVPSSTWTGTGCANEDATKIGQSIASSYAFTNTEEVMGWFCKGAEFEDILTALETEEVNGTPAEDMLKMRADGLTWDEIWQVVGLTEK